MFFQVLFIIVICLGIFLFASWFFSCLYTEWQLDAAERAKRKQEEELQVVKEQDPVSRAIERKAKPTRHRLTSPFRFQDGTEETNFIEETSITIDEAAQDKNKKQPNFVQMSDATLPSNQVLCSVYSQGAEPIGKKNKMKNSQKANNQQVQYAQLQQAAQIKQQYPNLTLQDIQQHQIKQMQQQAAQQRQIESIKQQYPNLTKSDILHLQQLQANLNNVNNFNNSANSNSVSINLSNNGIPNGMASSQQAVQQVVSAEIPTTVVDSTPAAAVEIVVEPAAKPAKPETKAPALPNEQLQQKIVDIVTSEIEKEIVPETAASQQSTSQAPPKPQPAPSAAQTASAISDEEIIKQLNLQDDKLPYRERKLEEYEFFKTALEIIDLSRELEVVTEEAYAAEFERAIDEADSRKGKINWTLVPSLHATDHLSAIEEIVVLLDQFLHSKFFKKVSRDEKMQVIDQLLRNVLSIITQRQKFKAKKKDHQEDLLFVWDEVKELLEQEKRRIKAKSTNKPQIPPKPQKPAPQQFNV